MSISEEFERLAELRKNGMLSEAEFQAAKAKVLAQGEGQGQNYGTGNMADRIEEVLDNPTLGRAAQDYISYKMITGVIGLVIFAIVALTMCSTMHQNMSPFPSFGPHM